ncbi:MAG: TonB-dependent receptor [Hyphomonadaceae bacterium]|nr:TonB-dependent receptor [Hyphomonadaceae bacterium]
MKKNNCLIAALLASTALASPAFAQSAAPQAAVEPAAEQEVAEPPEEDEIVVTVERRQQTLQDLAGTAAVLQGEDLKRQGIQNITDLEGRIPGVQFANNRGNIEVYIRGVGSSNNTELGDPAAATHLNGVYVPRPAGFGAAFFDIQRVEVNIGPQGTLRGRNATAGSVNIIPWAPGLGQYDAAIEASYGNFNEYTVEGVVNVPIGKKIATRVAGFRREHDSRLRNVSPCSDELGLSIPVCQDEGVGVAEAAEDYGVRAAILFQPTSRAKFTLTGDYLSQTGSGFSGVNFANPLGNGIDPDDIRNPRDVIGRGFTPDENTDHFGIKGQLDYDGNGFNIEYIGSYRDLVYDYEFVTPAGPFYPGVLDTLGPLDFDNFNRIRFITDSESIIQELRFFSDDKSRFIWTAGAFFFKEDQRTFLGTTGDRNPFFQGVEFNQSTDTISYSFYADATYKFTDKFRLTGGIRYTNDQKQRFGINAQYRFGFGGPNFDCCFTNGAAFGTEGFRFAGLNRTILNPDTNTDGSIDADEALAFLFNGVASFGVRDGIDDIFPGGRQIQDAQPDPATRAPCSNFALVGSCENFVPVFNGRVPFSLSPFNSSFALQNGRLNNDFIDWRARLEYDITRDNLVYFLVSTGNKSGGFNDNIPGTAGLGIASPAQNAPIEFETDTFAPQFGPETLRLFELGSKNEFDLGSASFKFNSSVFYYDYNNLQLSTLLSVAQILDFTGVDASNLPASTGSAVVAFNFNASEAEIYGAQFEGGVKLPGDWNMNATLLWLPVARVVDSIDIQDSRFQADIDPVNSVNRSIEGNRLIRTPRFQFNSSITKAIRTDFGTFDGVVSIGYRSSSNQTIFNGIDYSNPTNPAARLNDRTRGFVTLDTGVGYTHGMKGRWRIEGYASNLLNVQEPAAIIITQFDNTRFFTTPRLYGVRVRAKF